MKDGPIGKKEELMLMEREREESMAIPMRELKDRKRERRGGMERLKKDERSEDYA